MIPILNFNQRQLMSDELLFKLKPFNWNEEFNFLETAKRF
jgi:hypothetical protein